MKMPAKILVVIGTRPEAIKMAPIIRELQSDRNLRISIVNTGQHSLMLDQLLIELEIETHINLKVLAKNQGIHELYGVILKSMSEVMSEFEPDLVLVQGDTASAFVSAQAAFLSGVHVAHIEAGLRTYDLAAPFPEEGNRQLISRVASLHFAPTELAARNLISEGINPEAIHMVGNSIVDSVLWFHKRNFLSKPIQRTHLGGLYSKIQNVSTESDYCLVTLHRRENADGGFKKILSALKRFALLQPSFFILFPVHPNPSIRTIASEILEGVDNVILLEPLGYSDFLSLLRNSNFVLTDSGGIQEEAITLGIPVLVARASTERSEGMSSGIMRVLGSNEDSIFQGLLDSKKNQKPDGNLILESNPFGDGTTAIKVHKVIVQFLKSLSRI